MTIYGLAAELGKAISEDARMIRMEAAKKALLEDGYDFVYIHVEAPDEMGHQGLVNEKIEAIEKIDKLIVGPLVEGLDASGEDYRVLILPDHRSFRIRKKIKKLMKKEWQICIA